MVAIVYRLNDAIVLAIATAVVAALVFAMLALLCCCSPGCGAACAVLRWSVKAPLLMLRLGVQAAASAAAYGYRLLAIGSHTPRDARPAIGSHTSVEADTPLSDGGGLRRRVFAADGSDGENAAEDPRTLQAFYEDAALLFVDDEEEPLAPSAPPGTELLRVRLMRDVAVQSPVTYTALRRVATPRFVPLQAPAHGAWAGETRIAR